MANMQERLDATVITAEGATQKFYQVVHGTDTEVVEVDSGTIPTVSKALKDIRNSISTGVNDIVTIANTARNEAVDAKNEILNNSGFQIVSADLLGDNTIGLMADNIPDVNIVADISTDVSKTAAINKEIVTLSQYTENISIVAEDIANVNATGQNIENVNIVANNEDNINQICQNQANIDVAANNIADISTAADISSAISQVSDIASNVTTVAGIKDNIGAIVDNLESVQNAASNAQSAEEAAVNAKKSEEAAAYSAQQAAALANLDNASESVKGVIMLATEAEAEGGDNETKAMTPKTVKKVVDNSINAIDLKPYQLVSNLSQNVDASTTKYPSNYAVMNAVNRVITGLDLFDFKFTDYLLNDEMWVRSDTFSWLDGLKYALAYNHLVSDLTDAVEQTETIGTVTITYYLATDGHKICLSDQEENLLSLYTECGVAWYYLVDTENAKFKLPRTQYAFVCFRDAVGGYIAESLPNFQQNIGYTGTQGNGDPDGGQDSGGRCYPRYSGNVAKIVDPATVNPVYKTNAPVQQRATQMFLYFYLGSFTVEAEATINTLSVTSLDDNQNSGTLVELINGKADVDLSNVSPSQFFIDTVISWGMVDFSKQYVTTGNSFVTAENCEIYVVGQVETGQTGEVCANNVAAVSSHNSLSETKWVETSKFRVVKNVAISISGFIEGSMTAYITPLVGA